MPIFEIETTEKTYAITVGTDVMKAIMDRDWTDDSGLILSDYLEEILYCQKVEYNGNFGPHVHFTISSQYDTAYHMKKVMKLIDDYAKGKEFPE